MLPHRLRLSASARTRLANVAGGNAAADLELDGARVLNVFSGRMEPASIAIAEGRVARVGPPGEAHARESLDGALVIPGLIDPHTHVDMLCVPHAFLAEVARHGVTAVVGDTVMLQTFLEEHEMLAGLTALRDLPAKALWGLRSSLDEGDTAIDAVRLPLERLERLLGGDDVVTAGEVIAWRDAIAGDERIGGFLAAVTDTGMRLDGHAPGASARSLAMMAALGITSDHEAIDGDEVQRRMELGLWTMLRHSSLRPDAEALARAAVERGLDTRRMLLTADGVLPIQLVRDGHVDETLRRVIAGGIDPVEAVRMATLHPATYLGLDAHLGSVAPGRCADLVLVDDVQAPRARRVMVDGRWLEDIEPPAGPDWSAHTQPIAPLRLTAEQLRARCEDAPPLRRHGAFARLEPGGERGGTLAVLAARDGRWTTATTLHGLDLEGVASTYTGSGDVLLLGRDPEAMLAAHARVAGYGGGMAGGGVGVAMPIFGTLSAEPLPRLAKALASFEHANGVPGDPPFAYLTTFLTLPALPAVCLTPAGLVDVRAGTILAPPQGQ
jgi:adenine deaminase